MKQLKHRSYMTSACAAVAALAISAGAQTCYINGGANQQTIDGFGFSTAWCPALTSAQGSVLFGTGSGQLGFSLLRCRIDPNKSWATETANATVAHAHSAKVLGTPWSPPAAMKSNDNVVGGTLLTSQYGAYATYLSQAAGSIGLDYVSLQNEPDWNPTYESCSWTGANFDTFCVNNAAAIGKPVVMPECVGFNDTYSDPTLNDANAVGHISVVAGHFYGNGNYVHQNALNHGKHVWATEHYYSAADITTSITLAKEISDAMNNQFSAYFYWWIEPGDTASFISGTTVDKRGYVMGQFAHWVRPGKARLATTYNPQSNVYVTAYHNSGMVIVAINTSTSSQSQTFTLQSITGVTTLTPIRTSGSENMATLGSVTVANSTFTYTLAPQSVTTFAQFP